MQAEACATKRLPLTIVGMAGYPGAEKERRFDPDELTAFVATIFRACDMDRVDAELLATTLVVADMRGCHSHGVLRVPDYVKKLRDEGVNPKGRPRVTEDRPSAVVVDADNAMGQIACTFAMQRAVIKARGMGLAATAVGGSNHCGALAYFAMQALEQGLVGLATTNALPTMAPWGGVDKIVGINPLAVAIPAGDEGPIVIDAAFSASSHGKVRIYDQKGLALPEGWAFDAEGRETTDPAAALTGLLRPIGDYKGVGLAVVMGVLSTALSGASYGTELGNMVDGPQAGKDGQFLLALDPAAFVDRDVFGERVDRVVRQIRESRRAQGCEKIYAPGELEALTEARYRADGIPLNDETIGDLSRCAKGLGLSPLGG